MDSASCWLMDPQVAQHSPKAYFLFVIRSWRSQLNVIWTCSLNLNAKRCVSSNSTHTQINRKVMISPTVLSET